ncbi:MAG TPA: DUF1501 domain-containing protein [Phycisphaerales bacterium]|nr:DUF1501 domain-containing protein [Phycisphaerales bacterium]
MSTDHRDALSSTRGGRGIGRREFLAGGLAATSLLATGITLPGFLARTARAALPALDDRILVVIQLTGGNDGLNTVIPYEDDRYHTARPTLRVPSASVLRLGREGLGLQPSMTGMKDLYDRGLLSVMTNVGYPNPDRSHFRSMDIWHTASTSPEGREDGWLGRVVDLTARDGSPPPALVLDSTALPLAVKARTQSVPAVSNIDSFRLGEVGEGVSSAIGSVRRSATDDLLFVQRTMVESVSSARRIESVVTESRSSRSYPNYGLASRLWQIENLIGAGFGARVYYTSLDGFDTHSKQSLVHEPLLRELSDSLAAFMAGLEARGLQDRVLVLTYSEFGRRVRENGSQGTDHGAAAPMFLAGGACLPGVTGGKIDLADLDDGDVRHRIDFRCVYAAVLQSWIGVDPARVLEGHFEPAGIFRG